MGVEEDMNSMEISIFLLVFCFVCGCVANVLESRYAKVKKDLFRLILININIIMKMLELEKEAFREAVMC